MIELYPGDLVTWGSLLGYIVVTEISVEQFNVIFKTAYSESAFKNKKTYLLFRNGRSAIKDDNFLYCTNIDAESKDFKILARA